MKPYSLALVAALAVLVSAPVRGDLRAPGEWRLTDLRQLTFGGENAEAYWSPDGRELVMQ